MAPLAGLYKLSADVVPVVLCRPKGTYLGPLFNKFNSFTNTLCVAQFPLIHFKHVYVGWLISLFLGDILTGYAKVCAEQPLDMSFWEIYPLLCKFYVGAGSTHTAWGFECNNLVD